MGAESTFNELPGWAKGGIAVLGAVTVVGIGVAIYFAVKKRLMLAGSFKEKKDVDNAIDDLAKKGIKPTYKKETYSGAANIIFTSLDGYGTDETRIKGVMERMKNDSDVLSLMSAYGIREISSGDYNPAKNYSGTLAGALAHEFDADDIKTYVNKPLEKNGVTIRF